VVLRFLIIGDLVTLRELQRDNGPEIGKRKLVPVDVQYNIAILHVLCHRQTGRIAARRWWRWSGDISASSLH
jgi:hypothetical protein